MRFGAPESARAAWKLNSCLLPKHALSRRLSIFGKQKKKAQRFRVTMQRVAATKKGLADLQGVEANRGAALPKGNKRGCQHARAGDTNNTAILGRLAARVVQLAAGNTGVEGLVLVLGHALTALAKIDRALASVLSSVLCAAHSVLSSFVGAAADLQRSAAARVGLQMKLGKSVDCQGRFDTQAPTHPVRVIFVLGLENRERRASPSPDHVGTA